MTYPNIIITLALITLYLATPPNKRWPIIITTLIISLTIYTTTNP